MQVKLPTPPIAPSLPPKDPQSDPALARTAELGTIRAKYPLSNNNSLELPLLTEIPAEEVFSDRYQAERGKASAPLTDNAKLLSELAAGGNPLDALKHFSALEDYSKPYLTIPKPEVMADWLTDERFGEQRLSGFNPGMIQSTDWNNLPPSVNLLKLQDALKTQDWQNSEDLYVVDYSEILKGITGGTLEFPFPLPEPQDPLKPNIIKKYLPKPVAFFRWTEDNQNPDAKGGRLMPVAIQIDINDSGDVKTFTPDSPGMLWTIAKLCFCVADANVHEMRIHLGQNHFALEAFGAITPRRLAPAHPLNILLRPHLRFLVFNNDEGIKRLVNEGGPVNTLMAATLEGSIRIAVNGARDWSITQTFPDALTARGVDDVTALPHYPYRDDGLSIWNAIRTYVAEYLNLYYKTAGDITDDYELQAWAKELASTDKSGGHVTDMPDNIASLDQLTEIVTMIIFSNSAGHSAVNFPQYPLMGFVPNAALAGYADYQTFLKQDKNEDKSESAHLAFTLKFLPPKFVTIGQIAITNQLAAYHYDSLGDYSAELADDMAKQVVYRFCQNLNGIEATIKKRNQSRFTPYPYLQPSQILNSASI